MPKLILLNGPPGCGKSTLARMYVDDHPLTLNLDIDLVRSLIGRWRDDPVAAGLLARAISIAAARTHLVTGHDVVVPQYVGRQGFIREIERLAQDVGAIFHEIVLFDNKDNALRRFIARGQRAIDGTHLDAAKMIDQQSSYLAVSDMYDRLISVIKCRPAAKIVHTKDGQVEQAYRDFLRLTTPPKVD